MASNQNTAKYVNFRGLQVKDKSHEVGFSGLVTANNIDISRKRKPYRRAGYALQEADTIDSAWGDNGLLLYTSGADLKFFSGGTPSVIRSDLTPGGHIVAFAMGSDYYYSNEIETGVYNPTTGLDRTFGLAAPEPISLAQSYGSLPAGTYQAAITYVRGDGQVSGAGVGATISLSSEGGVVATIPTSSDPTVVYVDLYISSTDGSRLFKANRVVNGSSEVAYRGNTHDLQVPLRTQFKQAPPPFSEVDYFSSRLLLGVGNLVVYTDPFAYELVDLRSNYIPYNSRVTMIAVVKSGFFVGTEDNLWFLRGDNVKRVSAELVDSSGVVPHTKQYVKGDTIGIGRGEETDSLPFWVSRNGNICLGLPDGKVKNITEKSVSIPKGITGSALYRQEDGQNHFIAVVNS